MKWVDAVRSNAAEQDRTAISDQFIGQIFAHSPTDTRDSGWPHWTIRDAIDRLLAEHIDIGLMVERRNMRGLYSKSLYEGGKQERVLAEQYQKWADLARGQWPHMAQVLESIAKSWAAEAAREDARAEQDNIA